MTKTVAGHARAARSAGASRELHMHRNGDAGPKAGGAVKK
jgi:hypothetical protein